MNWISVKEKLPEVDQIVLVCRTNGFDGSPIYDWGARLDEADGWLWGVGGTYGLHATENASYNNIEADDDYTITRLMN